MTFKMIFNRVLQKGAFILFLALFITFIPGYRSSASGEAETTYYSDRFIFRGKDVDDLVLVVLNFNRGKEGPKYFGEFLGAIFYKERWAFLEGNDKYFYRPGDLRVVQPSYFAKAEGSPVSGFKLAYDGGDFTIKISSGPTQSLYTPNAGKALKKSIATAESVLTLRGREYWGELIHEPLVWSGFNGLKQYSGLFKEYQGFYLTTEKGRQIYFHQNKSDVQTFLKKHHLSETFQTEGGLIRSDHKSTYLFKPPISLVPIKMVRPPFAFYSIPQRWRVEAPSVGTLFLWSRENASKNWFFGGYYLMAIEGVLKSSPEEERVWGLVEYIP